MLMQRFLGVAQTRNFYPKHVDSENKKNRGFVWKSVGNSTKMSKRGLPRIQWWRHVKAAILSQLVTTDDESLLAAFPLSTFYNLHEWTSVEHTACSADGAHTLRTPALRKMLRALVTE